MRGLVVTLLSIMCVYSLHAQEKINWMSWDQVQAAQKQKPKKVFVDVYTDWCGWCKKMEAGTFQDQKIVKYLNQNYYSVRYNAEQPATIMFRGKEYKFVGSGRQGYHELAAHLLQGRFSYPTTVYLDENLDILSPVPGYLEVPMLSKILHYFGDGYYLKSDWATFDKTYTAP